MKSKLIYITNTRIPSEKANSYQSMQMCNSFAKIYDDVEMWIPKLHNNKKMQQYENNIFDFYHINETFKVKKFWTLDSKILYNLNEFFWSNTKAVLFAFNILLKLMREENTNSIVFTRDWYVLKILLLAKKNGLIKNKIFYEIHKYKERLINNYKKCDGIIVINDYLKQLHQKKGIKNILVAHDGVNLDEYKSINDYEYSQKEQYNLVYTGNLFAWKGVHTLVDSLEYINKNVELIIIGGSKEVLEDFKQYVKEKKFSNIIITGHMPKKDTIKYVQKADILFLPNSAKDKMSFYTSPIKLFEYMASKRPIIASKLPSIREILEDKKNAILFEPDNPKDLAEKINWTLENDCTDIVNQAFEDVQEYTWDKRAENIKKFMEQI